MGYKQARLTKLEKQLLELDSKYAADEMKHARLKGFDTNADEGTQPDMSEEARKEYIKDNEQQEHIMKELTREYQEYCKVHSQKVSTKATDVNCSENAHLCGRVVKSPTNS